MTGAQYVPEGYEHNVLRAFALKQAKNHRFKILGTNDIERDFQELYSFNCQFPDSSRTD